RTCELVFGPVSIRTCEHSDLRAFELVSIRTYEHSAQQPIFPVLLTQIPITQGRMFGPNFSTRISTLPSVMPSAPKHNIIINIKATNIAMRRPGPS
ncbi:hypothetical protein CAPTEDRAFT_126561, partial [Capitella teleta]